MITPDIEDRLKPSECDHIIAHAAAFILRWGTVDCGHHKQWVLDQTLRILTGTMYGEIIEALDGWSEGIPP